MKFCNRPFNSIHLDPNGGCRLCAWTDACIGNLAEDDLSTVWNSENANKIRDAIRGGNYEFCRKTSCPMLENDSLPEIEEQEAMNYQAEALPTNYSVACDFICNHSCPSCRNEVFIPSEEYIERLKTILQKIIPYLNREETVKILTDGNGDCFASPYIMQMLENIHPQNEKCTITLETNGALFDEQHWERIKHLANYNLRVTVTPNSFIKTTYEYLNGGHATYNQMMDNLAFIRKLRKRGDINWVRISIVLQERNFWEFPEFAERCLNEFNADEVVAKPLYRWFMLSQEDYWFKDVLNPAHPYHKEYLKMLEAPVLKNPKIYYWGAHNLHKERMHPMSIYKEHMNIAGRLLENKDLVKMLQDRLHSLNIQSLYIYGDMELGVVLYQILMDTDIVVKGFLARDIQTELRCGQKVKYLRDYKPDNNDTMLVLNYDFIEQIKKDFHFMGFYGKIISVKDLVCEVK